jgi:DNA topoisomerase IB
LDSSGKTRRKFAVEESERIRSSTAAAYRSKAFRVAMGGAAAAGTLHSIAQNAVIDVLDITPD